jgi:pimeloyl-ACP methyl ester carboxylesterase
MSWEHVRSTTADTIVLIHGLWMTPRSWELWVEYYRRPGYEVLAPAYPGLDAEVEELRADPSPIERLTIQETVDHYDAVIRCLARPPIIIGHSFGGTLVQLMLDRGLGAAGVAINSVPVKGVAVEPRSQPSTQVAAMGGSSTGHQAVPLTFEEFEQAFTTVSGGDEARAAYERYCIPAPPGIVGEGVIEHVSSHPATEVDFTRPDRAPLLFVAGGEDRATPPSLNRTNYTRYLEGSKAVVAYREFPGRSHLSIVRSGWQDMADHVLRWAEQPTATAEEALTTHRDGGTSS